MNSNKRPPPAFQEYASDNLAKMQFRLMSLEERGLWATLRFECWVNKTIPATIKELSTLLNLRESDIERALTNRVLSFFVIDHKNMYCPELEKYREECAIRTKALSEGGRNGGRKTQSKNKMNQSNEGATNEAHLEPSLQASPQAKVKPLRRNEESREELTMKNSTNNDIDEWVNDYERH
jgi:hypothetical protein